MLFYLDDIKDESINKIFLIKNMKNLVLQDSCLLGTEFLISIFEKSYTLDLDLR